MTELKCPGCQKEYADNNPPRLLTMCGHTFCQLCLKSMIKRKDYKFQVRCPLDKMKMTLDSATPLQFPRNLVLIDSINKSKKKIAETDDETNEFLPKNSETLDDFCRSTKNGAKSTPIRSLYLTIVSKKTSTHEEQKCLLHQKPSDIVCLEQKILICAECALFGLHKGHAFTSIRDLELQRNKWVSDISLILEQKK